jgi:small subunit ribosomal protein S17
MQQELKRDNRKLKQGVVVSNKMQKTVVVKVDRKFRHPQYDKVVVRSKKYYAHDESGLLQMGDVVSIMETRPLSKLKRWRVTEVVQKAQAKDSE